MAGTRLYTVLAFVLPMLLLAPLALETLRVERQELPLQRIKALPLRPSPPPRSVPQHAVLPTCTVAKVCVGDKVSLQWYAGSRWT